MTKPVDQLGIGPIRNAIQDDDGSWIITITPPSWTGFKSSSVKLDPDQYYRYCLWRVDNSLIQNALPELTDAQREILITGVRQADFATLRDEEDE